MKCHPNDISSAKSLDFKSYIDVNNEYRALIIGFNLFGANISFGRNNKMFTQYLLKKILTLFKIVWNVLSVYYYMVIPYTCFISENRANYVHALDLIAIITLRFVINSRIANLFSSIGELIQLRKQLKFQVQYQSFKKYLIIFYVIVIVNFTLWMMRIFYEENFNYYTDRYTFGIALLNSAQKVQDELIVFAYCVVSIMNLLFAFLPALTALIAYCSLIEHYRILNTMNGIIREILQNDITVEKLIRINGNLSKVTSIIKKVNDILSPILFIWCVYWIVNSCYSFSNLLGPHQKFGIPLAAYLVCTATLFCQFLFLIFMADCVDREILKTIDIIVTRVEGKNENFHDISITVNFALIISSIKRCRKQVFIAPLGMFRLEKKLILVTLGILLSYEMIILQLIEE